MDNRRKEFINKVREYYGKQWEIRGGNQGQSEDGFYFQEFTTTLNNGRAYRFLVSEKDIKHPITVEVFFNSLEKKVNYLKRLNSESVGKRI